LENAVEKSIPITLTTRTGDELLRSARSTAETTAEFTVSRYFDFDSIRDAALRREKSLRIVEKLVFLTLR
jgi:hypothetical protein